MLCAPRAALRRPGAHGREEINMRMLGTRSALPVFRWDLIHLFSNLSTDERPEIQALAPAIEAGIAELRSERDTHETIEDVAIVATARRGKRDGSLDELLVRFGGIARVSEKDLYAAAFKRYNPTETGRLALDEELKEVDRIVGEVRSLPAAHSIRVDYEPALVAAQTAVRDAITAANEADTALALSRSRVARFKLKLDELRLETHGRLLTILKSKAAADSFFRGTAKAPGAEADQEPEPEEPAAEAAAAG